LCDTVLVLQSDEACETFILQANVFSVTDCFQFLLNLMENTSATVRNIFS